MRIKRLMSCCQFLAKECAQFRNMKNIRIFYLKIFILMVKFSVYMKRRVFVMKYFKAAFKGTATFEYLMRF